MSMAVEPDSAGVRFPPPFIYLGALLLGLAAERFVTLRSPRSCAVSYDR
ncbi:hypothetical protein SAMN03159288_04787 [Rhizobium sp. NFACC06-2]|nr:hypothetical protein SAMN03159288_04787 [Rhizobium sp. NFACC06-2]